MSDYHNQPPCYKQLSEPPQGGDATYHPHQCGDYQIKATDMTIVRWCPTCGKTWHIIRHGQGGYFGHKWTEVQEP